MTVAELIRKLYEFPPDYEVTTSTYNFKWEDWDELPITQVEAFGEYKIRLGDWDD